MIKAASQTGAKPIARTYQPGATSLHTKLDVYTPEDVIKCQNADDLHALLRYYGRTPFIRNLVPDSTFARRYYVEKLRPALRWYCNHFGAPVPRWLKDTALPEWSADEKKLLFGDRPLEVTEFERRETPQPTQMQDSQKPEA